MLELADRRSVAFEAYAWQHSANLTDARRSHDSDHWWWPLRNPYSPSPAQLHSAESKEMQGAAANWKSASAHRKNAGLAMLVPSLLVNRVKPKD